MMNFGDLMNFVEKLFVVVFNIVNILNLVG